MPEPMTPRERFFHRRIKEMEERTTLNGNSAMVLAGGLAVRVKKLEQLVSVQAKQIAELSEWVKRLEDYAIYVVRTARQEGNT